MRVTKLLSPVTSGPPLSSRAILALAGLSLLSLALLAALVLVTASAPATYSRVSVSGGGGEPTWSGAEEGGAPALPAPQSPAPELPAAEPLAPEASGATPPAADATITDSLAAAFPADARPIPVAMLTRLEDAVEEPLEDEMDRLLAAVQTGYGEQSARVEPTLRPYVFRIAGRLSVRTEAFRITATAPTLALAQTRADGLRRLFLNAGVTEPRLTIGAAAGPHALTLD